MLQEGGCVLSDKCVEIRDSVKQFTMYRAKIYLTSQKTKNYLILNVLVQRLRSPGVEVLMYPLELGNSEVMNDDAEFRVVNDWLICRAILH